MRVQLHRRSQGATDGVREDEGQTDIDAVALQQLSSAVAPPRWLRDLGRASWLLVGFFALVVGLVWLLGLTYTIVGPVVAAAIVAAVVAPLVARLARHMPRAAAAAVVLLGLVGVAVVVVVIVIAGLAGHHDELAAQARAAAGKAAGWLESVGVDHSSASTAKENVEADVPKIIGTLATGVISGIRGLASVLFGLSLAALSLFFLLKDGPTMRGWIDRHAGVPENLARMVSGEVIRSLRGYFKGVTIVAAFNGVVVALAALLLDVPLAGTIGVVAFVTAYVPYIGAFVAGTFAVVIALGAKGATTALIMLVLFILANGLLQNLVQPFAMGAALDLHPLVTLVATIGAGCIFGTLGLILAAPLLAAAVHIARNLSRARALAHVAEPAP